MVRVARRLVGPATLAVGLAASPAAFAQVRGAGAEAAAPIVSAIRVEGNQRVEPETVISYMSIRAGERFDPVKLDLSLKALYATGLFGDVQIRAEGNDLVVTVVENPIINRVVLEGNSKLSEEQLTKELQVKPRVIFTRAKVQSDVQRMLELYRRAGRFAATIEPKIVQLPQNRVDLIFEIKEGPNTGVERISFIGNKAFTDGELREEIATRESRWYRFFSSEDNYDPDRMTYDRELLRKFYLTNGYADFRVLSAVADLTPERDAFFITFTVDEGEIYTFGGIDIESRIRDLVPDELRSQLLTLEGETYNAELIEKTIDRLTDAAGNLGYAFIDIRPVLKRDREKHTVSITYQINEAPRVYVERINIQGNVRTLDEVIRREFRLSEGDAFNTAKKERSRQRLQALGFFDKVDVTQVQGSAPDRTVMNVEVQERSTGELQVGAGFSSSEGVVGEVSVRERNLLGRGQDIRISASLSQKRTQFDFGFTEPYFLGRNVAAGIDLFNIDRDYQDEAQYDLRRTGFALRAGFNISEFLRMTTRYTLRQDEITNVGPFASFAVKEAEGQALTSMVGYVLGYDRRDRPQRPTDGYYLFIGQDFAGLGGDVTYIRTTAGANYYYPITSSVVASLSAEGGYIHGLGQNVRLNDRFDVGGQNLRGFKDAGIGPRDAISRDSLGGNIYAIGTAEVSFPVGLPDEYGIRASVFTDFGTLFEVDTAPTVSVLDDSSLRMSAGIGISWDSPFGPIRVDFAQALLKEDYDETQVFRFSFGTKF
ncbi:outer membrane protein assembly factor BamA [Zavarzinia compransoris]|uniref:Outer membrane protein assembly factor BamA n=1 Tax=Zavarzinia compransoris TaxID=1264899 RepID=A0A317EBZ4_9PROT|nr:outer membrane protein assembly factor BamA [Zavarzinia compransoris]